MLELSSLRVQKFLRAPAEFLGMDHHQLRVRHLRNHLDMRRREIAPDEADIAPAIPLLLLAIPADELRIERDGRLRQRIVVP